jgi:hypothetical protein
MGLRKMFIFTLGAKIKNLIKAFKTRVLLDFGLFEAESCLDTQLTELNDKNLLDSASLVITPNAYKETTLYSVVPNDGAGDMPVTRATRATRVNSDGLVEEVPYNIFNRTEAFGAWTKTASLTTINNTITAPNGTLTAETLRIGVSASSTRYRVYLSLTLPINTYTASFYLKKANHRWIQLVYVTTGVWDTNNWANFDLEDGVIGNTGTGAIATITDVGNGWYRCTLQGTNVTATSSTACEIVVINNTNGGRYPAYQSTVEEDVCYVWGAQLVFGTEPKKYLPVSTGFDIPRIDYSNGSCPSILVEPQRTNLIFPSDTLETQTRTVTAVAHTLSFYGTGSITLSGVATGTLNGTGVSNRVDLTFTPTAGSLTLTVTGSVMMAQLEVGTNATSYIPTIASTVTRNADVIRKTNATDFIGQTEGSIFIEFEKTRQPNAIKNLLTLRGTNVLVDTIQFQTPNNNQRINLTIVANGVVFNMPGGSRELLEGLNKVVFIYSTSGSKFFLNGVLEATYINDALPVMTNFELGLRLADRQWNAGIYQCVLWKTQITDAQAIQLTTL